MTECGGPVALDRHLFATQRLGLVVERSARAVPPGAAIGCGGTPGQEVLRSHAPTPSRPRARSPWRPRAGATLVPIAGALTGAHAGRRRGRGGRRPPRGRHRRRSRSRPSRPCSTRDAGRRTPSSASAWPRWSRRPPGSTRGSSTRCGAWPTRARMVDRALRAHPARRALPLPGATPGRAFDCSGLTSWAWSQSGVGLPHQSGGQIRSVSHGRPRAPCSRAISSTTPATSCWRSASVGPSSTHPTPATWSRSGCSPSASSAGCAPATRSAGDRGARTARREPVSGRGWRRSRRGATARRGRCGGR